MSELFTDPAPCCSEPDAIGCVCGPHERALRAIASSQYRAMTSAERDWCKQEIVSIEGYDESSAEGTDADVARTVLHAWTDYCRDKGMIP
jgi:hypothetical protein